MKNNKYSLEEIKQMLLEPSFDFRHIHTRKDIVEVIEEAIKHHNELEKFENRRGI